MIARRWLDKLALLQIVAVSALCLAPTPWIAFPAAALLALWFPGRLLLKALGWDQGAAGQAWLAVAASIVLIPLPLCWVWSFSNGRWAIWGMLLAVDLLLYVAARLRAGDSQREEEARFSAAPAARGRGPLHAGHRCAFAILVLFVGGCVFGTIWFPQADDRMIVSPMGDYVKHHAVLLSLERHPLPLHNMFYAAEKDTPYYYYQYHHHLAAALRKLTADSVSIPLAFAFTSALTAMAFVAAVFLLATQFLVTGGVGSASPAARGRGPLLAALCVSVIGGWDIIPTAFRLAAGARSVIILDSWSSCPWRIHNLMTQFVWCPQHVAATLAVVLAARWLRRAPSSGGWILMAPLFGASVFGSSVHLAMTVFAAAAIYVLLKFRALVVGRDSRGALCEKGFSHQQVKGFSHRQVKGFSHQRPREDAGRYVQRLLLGVCLMILLGLVLMAPQAWGYHQMSQRIPGGLTTQWPRFEYAFFGRLLSPGPLANLLDAPWILLVDFGMPLVACLLLTGAFWRSVWRDDGLRFLLLAGILGVLSVFIVRSNHSPFDYSFRIAVMPAQVTAAICAGALLRRESVRAWMSRRIGIVIVAGGVLGLPVGLYEAPMMAVRTLLRPPTDQAADKGAIRFLRDRTPRDAVIQGDPVRREGLGQLTDRQIGVTDCDNSHVRVFYPRDMQAMQRTQALVQEAFAADSSAGAFERLHGAGVNYVLAGTVERDLYGPMPQFDDDTRFECVYRGGQVRVYRLSGPP